MTMEEMTNEELVTMYTVEAIAKEMKFVTFDYHYWKALRDELLERMK